MPNLTMGMAEHLAQGRSNVIAQSDFGCAEVAVGALCLSSEVRKIVLKGRRSYGIPQTIISTTQN